MVFCLSNTRPYYGSKQVVSSQHPIGTTDCGPSSTVSAVRLALATCVYLFFIALALPLTPTGTTRAGNAHCGFDMAP